MAAERAIAEPLMDLLGRRQSILRPRAACRMWRELLEPAAARWFAAVVCAPSYLYRRCESCGLCVQYDTTYKQRYRLLDHAHEHPEAAAWAARCLTRAEPHGAWPVARCECGATRSDPMSPRTVDTLERAARIVVPGFFAALRRHVALPGKGLEFALRQAAGAGNGELAAWICESPGLEMGEVVLDALARAAHPDVVRALAKRFALHRAWRGQRPRALHAAGCAALARCVARSHAMREVLNAELGFRPREVAGVFREALAEGELDAARWIHDRVGVHRSAVTPRGFWVMRRMAERGDVWSLKWATDTLELTYGDGGAEALAAATHAGHAAVVAWLVERHALVSVVTDSVDRSTGPIAGSDGTGA